eukprot:gene12523-11904_t
MAAAHGTGVDKVAERRERHNREFNELEMNYAKVTPDLLRQGMTMRDVLALKKSGHQMLRERHQEEWAKAKEDC